MSSYIRHPKRGCRQEIHDEKSRQNEKTPSFDSSSEDSEDDIDEETSFLHSVAKLIGWNRAEYQVEAPASIASVCNRYMIFVEHDEGAYSYQLVKAIKKPRPGASSNMRVKYILGQHKGRTQNMKFELGMYNVPPCRVKQWALIKRCDQ